MQYQFNCYIRKLRYEKDLLDMSWKLNYHDIQRQSVAGLNHCSQVCRFVSLASVHRRCMYICMYICNVHVKKRQSCKLGNYTARHMYAKYVHNIFCKTKAFAIKLFTLFPRSICHIVMSVLLSHKIGC